MTRHSSWDPASVLSSQWWSSPLFFLQTGRCEGTTPSRTRPAAVAGLGASPVPVPSQLILTDSFRGVLLGLLSCTLGGFTAWSAQSP